MASNIFNDWAVTLPTEDESSWAELVEGTEESHDPNHKKWFAWYPVNCYDAKGDYDLGWFWLTYVWYVKYNGKYYYFKY